MGHWTTDNFLSCGVSKIKHTCTIVHVYSVVILGILCLLCNYWYAYMTRSTCICFGSERIGYAIILIYNIWYAIINMQHLISNSLVVFLCHKEWHTSMTSSFDFPNILHEHCSVYMIFSKQFADVLIHVCISLHPRADLL